MYECMNVCMHACMHVYMHVLVYIHTPARKGKKKLDPISAIMLGCLEIRNTTTQKHRVTSLRRREKGPASKVFAGCH